MQTQKNKKKIKKVIKGLSKASKTHAAQAKTLKGVLRSRRKNNGRVKKMVKTKMGEDRNRW